MSEPLMPDAAVRSRPFFTWVKNSGFVFWTLAAVLLFLNLGVRGLTGSEGRWLAVVREMFISGDFLHPTINFQPYFDKPLGSYWLIAGLAWFRGGEVTELLIRLPSAAAGLLALWGTRLIAGRFAGRDTAIAAGWILLTVYSFAFWGRLGEADMLNLAFGALAAGWYVARRDNTDFGSYLLFGLLLAIGGQTKGLSAIAVPLLAAATDAVLCGSWKRHVNWRIALAGAIAILIYLTPFLLAAAYKGNYSANGLYLVYRENILRFFRAFDHREPWYAYFVHLPQLFLPWTPFLILALFRNVRFWRAQPEGDRWLTVVIAVVFAFFSLSDSKRVYYILPVLPYCAVLTARFLLAEEPHSWLERTSGVLLKIYDRALPAAGAVMLICGAVGAGWSFHNPAQNPALASFLPLFFLSLIPPALVLILIHLPGPRRLIPGNSAVGNFRRCALSFTVIFIAVFGFILPCADASLRTTRPFFAAVRHYLAAQHIPDDRVFFYRQNHVDPACYLGRRQRIQVLSEPELAETVRGAASRRFAVIARLRDFQAITPPGLRKTALDHLCLKEPLRPWENRQKAKKKYVLFSLPGN